MIPLVPSLPAEAGNVGRLLYTPVGLYFNGPTGWALQVSAPSGTGFMRVTGGVPDAAAIGETGTGNVVRSASPTFTGLILAAAMTLSGNLAAAAITFASTLESSTTTAILATNGAGAVALRPNGAASTNGQMTVASTGEVVCDAGGGVATAAAAAIQLRNSVSYSVGVYPKITASSLNATNQLNDTAIIGQGSAVNLGTLNLTTWSSTAVGVRITATTVVISGTSSLNASPTAGSNDTKIATTAYVRNAGSFATYRLLLDSSASHTAARGAATYGMGQGDPALNTGAGSLYPLNVIYIDSANYPTVDGLSPKLRILATLFVNDTAPTGNYTFGLHPITRPATSGGAGVCIYTIGAAVASCTVITAPAVDSNNFTYSADFALPANGYYVLGFVSSAAVATNSHLHMSAQLLMRYS